MEHHGGHLFTLRIWQDQLNGPSRETSSKDPYIVVNVGSEEWTFTMESLAQKISSCLGNVDVRLIQMVNLILVAIK